MHFNFIDISILALLCSTASTPPHFKGRTLMSRAMPILDRRCMSAAGLTHAASLAKAIRLSRRHLFTLLLPMYILALLDRVNIGFAKEAYQASTGLSDGAYAFGAGLFFLTYALFEIPSNLILHQVGARVWMARI